MGKSAFDHNHSATDAVVSTNRWGQCDSHLIKTTKRVTKGGEIKAEYNAALDLSSANGSTTLPASFSHQEKLHHYFEKSCDRNPDATALHFSNVKLSYVELDNRANRLAHFLHNKRQLYSGARAAILMERSVDMYVTLLAVLKCGAAFVPIDPSVPCDRVKFVIEDSEACLLLSSSVLSDLYTDLECSVVLVDKQGEAINRQPVTRPLWSDPSDSLCYIIYTSGSTGKPKGVGIHHSKICNFISIVTPLYGFMQSDRVYQGISLSFDFAFEEIWTTFAIGATLVPGPTDHRRLGPGLRQYLQEHEITILCCVPTLLSTIDRDIPTLRVLIVGGEACPEELVREWSHGGRVMLNTYGPTETTVTCSVAKLVPNQKITIGKPLPTYSMHILDKNLRPVADGEVGEIFIGGNGVAEGYIKRPDKTEECFLRNHLVDKNDNDERLYRTGDLGRLTPDGEIEFLGRCDSQVKIRGHRIELGEVESVLLENKNVESAVASLVKVGSMEALVAYVVTRGNGDGEGKMDRDICDTDCLKVELFKELCSRVPRYEVPSFLEVLETLPTLPSGKINRRMLPSPSSQRLATCAQAVVPPETSLERKLVEVYESIFGGESISVEADFFEDLGGHSLTAAQVASKLRKEDEFQNLPIADIYAFPTIRSLAKHIEGQGASNVQVIEGARDPFIHYSSSRVWMCGLGQLAFFYLFSQVLSIPFSFLVINKGFHPFLAASLVGSYALPVALLLPFAAKWILIGHYRPGRYPLWGWYYTRWWIARGLMSLGPLSAFNGTPWLAPYMRCMGSSVGKGSYLGYAKGFLLPDLIEIGDNVSLGYGVTLEAHAIRDGWLYQGHIKIESNAFIGNNSVIMLGASVGESSCVLEQSLVAENQSVPNGETWSGSPSKRVESDKVLLDMKSHPARREWTNIEMMGYMLWILLFFFTLLPVLILGPSLATIWFLGSNGEMVQMTKVSPIGGVIFVLSTCLWIALSKRIILFRTPEGIFPLRSWLGMRKWVTDSLMGISLGATNSLYATLYTSPWLRAVGAKVGTRAEVSTVSYVDPDLMTLNEESFIADIAMIGTARHHHDCVFTGSTNVGVRSFVGNAALLPPGRELADNCLIGVLSVPPPSTTEIEPGSNWLGSPAIYLPRRQESPKFNEAVTFHPSRRLVAMRLAIEFFRVFLPAVLISMFSMMGILMVWWLVVYNHVKSFLVLSALIPGLYLAVMMTMYLVIVAMKWIVVGRYVPHVAPLWSHFVWRSELITALYESAAVPGLIGMTLGTPFMGPLLRLLGMKVGARVYLETTHMTEFDLVRVADDVSVGYSCSLQTHLFEDRVMKMSYVNLEKGTSLGPKSIVLYDSTVEENTFIDGLSLIMKGERIPAGTEWRGIPAEPIIRRSSRTISMLLGSDDFAAAEDIVESDEEEGDVEVLWESFPTAMVICGVAADDEAQGIMRMSQETEEDMRAWTLSPTSQPSKKSYPNKALSPTCRKKSYNNKISTSNIVEVAEQPPPPDAFARDTFDTDAFGNFANLELWEQQSTRPFPFETSVHKASSPASASLQQETSLSDLPAQAQRNTRSSCKSGSSCVNSASIITADHLVKTHKLWSSRDIDSISVDETVSL
jgi:non-ribosomal peptide synthetase-like protein